MKLLSKNLFDRLLERGSRRCAQRISRRSLISMIGNAVVASAALPLLPVYRKAQAGELSSRFARNAQTKDTKKCNYWRYCALDGYAVLLLGGGRARARRERPLPDVVDRLVRESRGRQDVPDRLSRLLWDRLLRPLLVPRPGGRYAELSTPVEQRHHLVLRRVEHGVSLLERSARGSRQLALRRTRG